jgi:O-antigen ligase
MKSIHRRRHTETTTNVHTTLLFSASVALLCFAPLMRAGRMYTALWILEILGVLLLVLAFWKPLEKQRIPTLAWVVIAAYSVIPLLYLIPLPQSLWLSLPGRNLYAESITLLSTIGGTTPDYLALSLVPYRTVSSILALLPVVGIFIASLILPRKKLITLVYIFLSIAAFQASLGLIQYGSGAEWAFWWGVSHGDKNALGTYPNYDHFAGLMELTIPLALALSAYHFHNQQREEDAEHQQMFNQTLLFFCLAILLILGAIFSRSRTGITLVMLGILLSTFTFAKHLGGQRALSFGTVMVVISLGVASSAGLIPVLNRFGQDPVKDVRWEIFNDTWIAIKQFFPFGSGPQTFQPIFFAFQPPELQNFVNHAHNDYLELLFETGLLGLILLVLSIVLYGYGWLKLRKQHWDRFHFIQTAAGISLLLLALHGFVDFNFHTPANMIFFAFLAGIFLHPSSHKKSPR